MVFNAKRDLERPSNAFIPKGVVFFFLNVGVRIGSRFCCPIGSSLASQPFIFGCRMLDVGYSMPDVRRHL